MKNLINNSEYRNWLIEIKSKIKNSQIKAALKVNTELIVLYWDIGKMIVNKQSDSNWGSSLIEQVAKDLKTEFVDVNGFSRSNLYSMRKFYLFYNDFIQFVHQVGGQIDDKLSFDKTSKYGKIVHQLGGQLQITDYHKILTYIPWRHHVVIMQKVKELAEALFYITQTIENNWSRAILEYQIETGLYRRQGKAISNFKRTLPESESDLAQQLLKDPYKFDFLSLGKQVKEKDLEDKLIEHITQFLLELGKGFAYTGRQFPVKVGIKEFRTDLLFYHTKLKAYVIIELKMKEFEPEFIGKLNFYLTAINEKLKSEDDKTTIGILLCKDKDNYMVDFSLRDVNKPTGVSEFTYTELPENLKNALPTEQEFQNQLSRLKTDED